MSRAADGVAEPLARSHRQSTLTLFVDGACLGNPGPAGIGAVFVDAQGRIVARLSKSLGHATNNIAEYLALVYALSYAQQRGITALVVKTDSELMARQLSGEYKVRDATLRLFYDLVTNLRHGFASCSVEHILRGGNAEADKLAGAAAKRGGDTSLHILVD